MTCSARAYARFQTGARSAAGRDGSGAAELTARVWGLAAGFALRPRPGHHPEPARGGEDGVLLGVLFQCGGPVSGYSRATAHAPPAICSNSVKAVTRNSADSSASPV